MDNKNPSSSKPLPHELTLHNRTNLKISGIIEVISATATMIYAKSSAGGLIITGENLKIQNLNNENKTLEVNGIVSEIKYNQKKKKLLEKLFK